MNPLDSFEQWASRARGEKPPGLDVADRVLRRVRAMEPGRESNRFLVVFSAAAALAACVMAVVALEACDALTHPLAGVFDTLTLVMP